VTTEQHVASWAHLEENPLKLVFIAGPYIGDGSVEAIEANIREAESYAVALANAGIGFFCPHLHTEHFGSKATADEPFYHRLDFQFLLRSDAALFTPRWKASSGARREHDWAEEKGLTIFYPESPSDIGDIIAWNKGG
jgi:hypothetical protein